MDALPPDYLRRIVRRIVSSLSANSTTPLHSAVRRLANRIQREAVHPLGRRDLVNHIVVRLLDAYAASVRSTRRETNELGDTQRVVLQTLSFQCSG